MSLDVQRSRATGVVGDVMALPFAKETFDVVLAIELIEHVREPGAAVREMLRVARCGGTVVLSTRFLYPLHAKPRDYWRFTASALRYLCRGFDAVRVTPLGNEVVAIFDLIVGPRNPLRALSGLVARLSPRERGATGFLVEARKAGSVVASISAATARDRDR